VRDEFLKKTQDIIAERVGVHCSNPECGCPTSGPESAGGTVNIGVAAHITAAAPGGPRYDSAMTSEERSGPDNGIWLCSTCATRIDRDPQRYSVAVLREWRRLAENKADRALGSRDTRGVVANRDLIEQFGNILWKYEQLERRCVSERGSDDVSRESTHLFNEAFRLIEASGLDHGYLSQLKVAQSPERPFNYPSDKGWLFGLIKGRKQFIDRLISELRRH
jgi:hypothetical protein